MNMLYFQGYVARVEFDNDDGLLVGRLVGIKDGVTFHADNVADLNAAFRDAVEDYIETCAKLGKTPESPYAGRLTIDLDPDLHLSAALAADRAGKDLSEWAGAALRAALGKPTVESGR